MTHPEIISAMTPHPDRLFPNLDIATAFSSAEALASLSQATSRVLQQRGQQTMAARTPRTPTNSRTSRPVVSLDLTLERVPGVSEAEARCPPTFLKHARRLTPV